jgi:hypothetical protein
MIIAPTKNPRSDTTDLHTFPAKFLLSLYMDEKVTIPK